MSSDCSAGWNEWPREENRWRGATHPRQGEEQRERESNSEAAMESREVEERDLATYLGRRAGSPHRDRLLQTPFLSTVLDQCCCVEMHGICEGKRVWVEKENWQVLRSETV